MHYYTTLAKDPLPLFVSYSFYICKRLEMKDAEGRIEFGGETYAKYIKSLLISNLMG